MPAKKRIIKNGEKFNHLTIEKEIEPYINPSSKQEVRKFLCKCECGNTTNVTLPNLISTLSCGCMRKKISRDVNIRHNMCKSPEYRSWRAMKARCLNSNHYSFKNYGGRGIKIHKLWIDSFEIFIDDMGKRPTLNHTLDRIDNDGNYEPNNCRWATYKQQAQNKKRKEVTRV